MIRQGQAVPYDIFVTKIECANHTCKAYQSRLKALAKDNLQFCSKGGLTKKVIQRLIVGTRIAVTKHSVTNNVSQLQHDLQSSTEVTRWGTQHEDDAKKQYLQSRGYPEASIKVWSGD